MTQEKMSIWGVGPIFFPLSVVYFTVMILVSYFYYPEFQIKFISYHLIAILAIILLAIGIPFWIFSLRSILKSHKADHLVTTGVFRCCRHPLYSAWTVFNVPAIALLTKSWIALTTPVFMYVLLNTLTKKEEVYLENTLGSEYLDYKNRVPCIVPLGFIKNS